MKEKDYIEAKEKIEVYKKKKNNLDTHDVEELTKLIVKVEKHELNKKLKNKNS